MITTLYQKTLSRKLAMTESGEVLNDPEEMARRTTASKGKILNLMRYCDGTRVPRRKLTPYTETTAMR